MSSQQLSYSRDHTHLKLPETPWGRGVRRPLTLQWSSAPRLIEGNFLPWLCFSLHTLDIRSGEPEKNPVPRSPPPTVRQWGLTARPPAAPGPGSPQDLPGPPLLPLLPPRATPLHAPERARDSPGRAGNNGARMPRAPTPARRATTPPTARAPGAQGRCQGVRAGNLRAARWETERAQAPVGT